MVDFNFQTKRETPDYTQILNILGQRLNMKDPMANAIDSISQGAGQGMQLGQQLRQIQQQKQQQMAMGQALDSIGNNPNIPAEIKQYIPLIKANPNEAVPLIQSLMKQQTQKPTTSIWMNSQGDITMEQPQNLLGWKELKVNPNSALQAGMSEKRTKAMGARADAWNRSIDTRQIDYLAKSVGFTPKMISQIQNTATRAQRGLEILNKPNVTWQELNAAGIDFAGIMQGGAPHVGEVVNTQFPNWHQQVAKWQTYLDGNNPANVPPEIQSQMFNMLQGVANIDYKFIQSSNKFNRSMVGPTIRGGLNQSQTSSMNDVEKAMIGGGNSDLSKMSDDELRRIAAGGQ